MISSVGAGRYPPRRSKFRQGEIDGHERIAFVFLAVAHARVETPRLRGGDGGLVELAVAAGFFHRDVLRRAVDRDQHLQDDLAGVVFANGLRRIFRRAHPAIADVFARRDVRGRRRRRRRRGRRRGRRHRCRRLRDDRRRRGRRWCRRRLELFDDFRRRLLRRFRRRRRRGRRRRWRFDELDRHYFVVVLFLRLRRRDRRKKHHEREGVYREGAGKRDGAPPAKWLGRGLKCF